MSGRGPAPTRPPPVEVVYPDCKSRGRDPVPIERPPDPNVSEGHGHLFLAAQWPGWRARRCRRCHPLPDLDDQRVVEDLLRTDPREWVLQAEREFDEAHRVRLPGEPPAPPRPDPGERAKH